MNAGKTVIIGFALIAAAVPALAVEAAVGRTLPGAWVMPQGGVVGPTPGWSFTIMPIGYMGRLSGQAEVAGLLVADLSASVSINLLVPQYVYKTESTKVNFSSSFYAPVNWLTAEANVQINNRTLIARNANAGLADVFFSPITVGIHFSPTNNLAIDTKIFAPTGAFRPGNLSNLGMNEWTIQPNLAHTYLWEKRGLEVDNYVGFDIYSKNTTTNYTSGTVFHWDGMIIQYLSKRFGFGAIVSNVTQINKDKGPIANLLNGFQGGAWGAGPMILWVAKAEHPGVTLQVRWVPEFTTTNLMKGNTLLLGLTFNKL